MIKLKSKKFYQTNNYYGVSLNVRKREKKSSRKVSDSSKNPRLLQLLSFALPILILLGYFAYRKTFPFGNSSILTVDLGQQYVDFLFILSEHIAAPFQSILLFIPKCDWGQHVGNMGILFIQPV